MSEHKICPDCKGHRINTEKWVVDDTGEVYYQQCKTCWAFIWLEDEGHESLLSTGKICAECEKPWKPEHECGDDDDPPF